MSSPFDAVPADQFPAEWVAQDKGPSILGVCISVTVLSTIFVIMRLFTRQKIMGALHLDDYLVTLATFSEWANVAMAIMAVKSGNGKHFALLTKDEKQNAIFWTILGFPFGIVAFGTPKLAVASLLIRLMNPNKFNKICLWAVSGLCLATLLGCVVILYAQCTPAYSQWNFDVAGTCISKWVLVDYAIFAGGFSAFVDLYLALYPASVLWTLQINLRKKIALCVALGIGSIATVVAIYKCTRLPSLAGADFSYDTSDLVIWTIVESSTIIIACCIPVLRPLVDVSLRPPHAGRLLRIQIPIRNIRCRPIRPVTRRRRGALQRQPSRWSEPQQQPPRLEPYNGLSRRRPRSRVAREHPP
uniref:Rhodopsin domain-containing protein n=1 Tax=Bionectria ochroleuca TaxID=29856 RepID=A0A8H7K8U6_BIOOC